MRQLAALVLLVCAVVGVVFILSGFGIGASQQEAINGAIGVLILTVCGAAAYVTEPPRMSGKKG
jgi:hypothetical protein